MIFKMVKNIIKKYMEIKGLIMAFITFAIGCVLIFIWMNYGKEK